MVGIAVIANDMSFFNDSAQKVFIGRDLPADAEKSSFHFFFPEYIENHWGKGLRWPIIEAKCNLFFILPARTNGFEKIPKLNKITPTE